MFTGQAKNFFQELTVLFKRVSKKGHRLRTAEMLIRRPPRANGENTFLGSQPLENSVSVIERKYCEVLA